MLSSLEMQERHSFRTNIIRLTSFGSQTQNEDKEIYSNIAESVRQGQTEFLSIVLQDGIEKKLYQKELETYHQYVKLKIIILEHQLINAQKEEIKEALDKICEGANAEVLKQELYETLKYVFDSTIQKAIDIELEIQNEFKARFQLLKCKPLELLDLKLFYTKYFNKHVIATPLSSLSDTLLSIALKISDYNEVKDKILDEYLKISNELEQVQKEFIKAKELQKDNFIRFLKSIHARNAMPLIFQYDPADIKSISKLLYLNISPDLIDPITGETLLYIAVNFERTNIVRMLLEKGADPFVKNTDGQSAHEKASLHANSQCLKIMQDFIKGQALPDYDTKDAPKELLDIINPVLEQAKLLLDQYGIKLQERKDYSLFLRVLLQYESRLDSRSKEFATYSEKLRVAKRDLDIHVFFDEIVKLESEAKRGFLNNSTLHDPLVKLMEKFLRDFDTHSFNELRNNKTTNQNASPNSDMIKMLKEKLESAKKEIAYLKARRAKDDYLERPAVTLSAPNLIK